jgi:hypothetical protein
MALILICIGDCCTHCGTSLLSAHPTKPNLEVPNGASGPACSLIFQDFNHPPHPSVMPQNCFLMNNYSMPSGVEYSILRTCQVIWVTLLTTPPYHVTSALTILTGFSQCSVIAMCSRILYPPPGGCHLQRLAKLWTTATVICTAAEMG